MRELVVTTPKRNTPGHHQDLADSVERQRRKPAWQCPIDHLVACGSHSSHQADLRRLADRAGIGVGELHALHCELLKTHKAEVSEIPAPAFILLLIHGR